MIDRKLNLICKRSGHKHYSPNPEYWVGKYCETVTGTDQRKKCNSRMILLEDAPERTIQDAAFGRSKNGKA